MSSSGQYGSETESQTPWAMFGEIRSEGERLKLNDSGIPCDRCSDYSDNPQCTKQKESTSERCISGDEETGGNLYIIYIPNLGLVIAVFVREGEYGRFRGSTGGALGEHAGIRESTKEGAYYCCLYKGGRSIKPELDASYPAIAAHIIYNIIRHCCLAQVPAA